VDRDAADGAGGRGSTLDSPLILIVRVPARASGVKYVSVTADGADGADGADANAAFRRLTADSGTIEDIPVPLSRLYHLAMGLSEQIFAISERLLNRAGRPVSADWW
jgi:hypothetical protein